MLLQNSSQRKVSALERGWVGNSKFPIVDLNAYDQLQTTLASSRFFQPEEQDDQVLSIHYQRTAYVRVEEGNERNAYTFTGLLLPFEWQEVNERDSKVLTRLRNRTLIISHKSYPWFEPFCQELLEDGTPIRIRIRVNALHGDRLAFIVPAARSEEHAKAEWTVSRNHLRKDLPDRFYQYSSTQLARMVYERFVRIKGGSVTHYIDDRCEAIAVDRLGKIYVLSNGENIEGFINGSLKFHDVIMDTDIMLCVRAKQLSSIAELNKLTENAQPLEKLLNPY